MITSLLRRIRRVIGRLRLGQDEQNICGDGNAAHTEGGKIFNCLKQGGVNGSPIALFEFEQTAVVIAVAVVLHGFGRQVELFVKQFLDCFLRGKGHCGRDFGVCVIRNSP